MNQASVPRNLQTEEESGFGFTEHLKRPTWKSVLFRPATAFALVLLVAISGFIVYLEYGNPRVGLRAPEVSYSLLPNEGRTEGVPIAIKLNQIAVFVVDDPMSGGSGAARAKTIVDQLQQAVVDLKAEPGKAITFLTDGPLPAIVLQNADGTERRILVRLMEGDVTLSGETDGKRVARVWAERLTDSLKVLAFGEPPLFSTGTEFGDALETMYASAKASGSISRGSLDDAFSNLTDAQRLALETLPKLQPSPLVEEVLKE